MSGIPLHPHKGSFKDTLAAASNSPKSASTPPQSKDHPPKEKNSKEPPQVAPIPKQTAQSLATPPVEPPDTPIDAAAVVSSTQESGSEETEQVGNEPAIESSPSSPEQCAQESITLGTNLYSLPDVKFWQYSLVCTNGNVLTKQERRWAENAFLQENKIDLLGEDVAAMDGHTFIAARKYEFLQNQCYVGNIVRRTEKQDASFKQVFLGKDQHVDGKIVKAWSCLIPSLGRGDYLRVQRHYYGQSSAEESHLRVCDCVTLPVLITCELLPVTSDPLPPLGTELDLLARRLTNVPVAENTTSIVQRGNKEMIPHVIHGNKVFDFSGAGEQLGHGLEYRYGVAKSMSISSNGVKQALQSCGRVFFGPMKVSDFVASFLSGSPGSDECGSLEKTLRGLRIKVDQGFGRFRIATVSGVGSTPPAHTWFKLVRGGCAEETTVEAYFTGKHTFLTHPAQPCLVVGSLDRPQFLPTCVCDILPGQSFRHALPIAASARLGKVSQARRESSPLRQLPKPRDVSPDSKTPDIFKALTPNRVLRAVAATRGTEVCALKLTKSLVRNPDFKDAYKQRPFMVVFVEVGNDAAVSTEATITKRFVEDTVEDLQVDRSGPAARTCKLKSSQDDSTWSSQLQLAVSEALKCFKSLPIPLILPILSSDQKLAYKRLKKLCDVVVGYHSCCINISTLRKHHKKDPDMGLDTYSYHLLRRISAKLAPKPVFSKVESLSMGVHIVPVQPLKEEHRLEASRRTQYLISIVSMPLGTIGFHRSTIYLKEQNAVDWDEMVRDHLRKEHGRTSLDLLQRILLYHAGPSNPTTPKSSPENGFREVPNIDISLHGSSEMTAVAMSKTSSSQSADSTLGKSIESLDKARNLDLSNGGYRPSKLSSQLNLEASERGDAQEERKTKGSDEPKGQQDARAVLRQALVQLEAVELSQGNQSNSASLVHIAVGHNANIRFSADKDEIRPEGNAPGSKPQQNVGYIARDGVTHADEQDFYLQKDLPGEQKTPPLHLKVLAGLKDEAQLRQIQKDAFEASFDYPQELAGSNTVAPLYFARLAAKRALLYMERLHPKDNADEGWTLLKPHRKLANSLYYT